MAHGTAKGKERGYALLWSMIRGYGAAPLLAIAMLGGCRKARPAELPDDFAISVTHNDEFSVKLNASGAVEFDGRVLVFRRGRQRWNVGPEAPKKLAPIMEELRLHSYSPRTFCGGHDKYGTSIAVFSNGGTREISIGGSECWHPHAELFERLAAATIEVSGVEKHRCESGTEENCIDRPSRRDAPTLSSKQGCNVCHSLDGSKTIGPSFKGAYGRKVELASGEVVTADETYLREAILRPATHVVAGYPPSMPTYKGRLRMGDVDVLVQWIKTLR